MHKSCVSASSGGFSQPGMCPTNPGCALGHCPTPAQHRWQLGLVPSFENWPKREVGAKIFLLQPICPQPKAMVGECNGSNAGMSWGWRAAGSRFWQPSTFLTGSVQDRGHRVARFCQLNGNSKNLLIPQMIYKAPPARFKPRQGWTGKTDGGFLKHLELLKNRETKRQPGLSGAGRREQDI